MDTREAAFKAISGELGFSFEGEMQIGGNYLSAIEHDNVVYVSGQIPRVGSTVEVTGRAGAEVSLEQARHAARICTMRAVAVLRGQLNGLTRVKRMLRMTVYVRSASDFTRQSEVADAASEVLHAIFSEAGSHTRTSVGVFQLPKGASVEIDLIAAIDPAPEIHVTGGAPDQLVV